MKLYLGVIFAFIMGEVRGRFFADWGIGISILAMTIIFFIAYFLEDLST